MNRPILGSKLDFSPIFTALWCIRQRKIKILKIPPTKSWNMVFSWIHIFCAFWPFKIPKNQDFENIFGGGLNLYQMYYLGDLGPKTTSFSWFITYWTWLPPSEKQQLFHVLCPIFTQKEMFISRRDFNIFQFCKKEYSLH